MGKGVAYKRPVKVISSSVIIFLNFYNFCFNFVLAFFDFEEL